MPLKKTSKSSQTKPSLSDLKTELLKWICQRHATNRPLDRQLLRTKALSLATTLGFTGFKCSEAWLTLFLKTHGFSPSLTNCSGPTFPDYRVWIDLLRSVITQYRYKDLFNVDELVMYSDFMPGRFPINDSKRRQHGDVVADPREILFPPSRANRVGIVLCANSAGTEKLPPLVSGPYPPDNSRNYCCYYRNEDSSVPDEIFDDWLVRLNADMARSDRKILLLLNRDRIRANLKSSTLSHVNLLYFPKDYPSKLKPLRGDVFHCVKMIYRRIYVQHVRSFNANKRWGAKEIVESVVQGWKNVGQDVIIASFRRTKLREDESFLKINCPGWDDLETGISFEEFVTFDDELSNGPNRWLEDLELLAGDHKHGYNLRNCCRGTVHLDDFGTVPDRSKTRRKKISNEGIGDILREKLGTKARSKKKIRNEDCGADSEEGQRVSDSSHVGDEDICSDDETSHRTLVDRTNNSSEDGNPSATDIGNKEEEPSGSAKNCDSFDDAIDVPRQVFEITRDSRLSDVSDGVYEGKFSDEDVDGEGYSRKDSMRENGLDFERDGRRTQSVDHDEVVQTHFDQPGPNVDGEGYSRKDSMRKNDLDFERDGRRAQSMDHDGVGEAHFDQPGPSNDRLYVPLESSGDANLAPEIRKFDAKKKNSDDQPSRSMVFDANDRRDASESFDNDGTSGHEPSKRPADSFVGSEPVEKRSRTDCSWVKRYETDFVFGPDLRKSGSGRNNETSGTDVAEVGNHEPVTKSNKMESLGTELDKRCVFGLEGGSLGLPFPATKD